MWEGRNRERKKDNNKRKEKGFMKENDDGIRGEKMMPNREGKYFNGFHHYSPGSRMAMEDPIVCLSLIS